MRKLKVLFILMLLISSAINLKAQGVFTLHGGVSLPTGEYASNDLESDVSGGAGTGFNLGLKYDYAIGENGFGLFAGVDLGYNGMNSEMKRKVRKAYESLTTLDVDITFPTYKNFPVSLGGSYTYKANEDFMVYANLGVVANFLVVSDTKITIQGQTLTTAVDNTSNFGFKVGGGFLITENISVGFDYWGLGKHSMNITSQSGTYSEEGTGNIQIDYFTLTVGFRL